MSVEILLAKHLSLLANLKFSTESVFMTIACKYESNVMASRRELRAADVSVIFACFIHKFQDASQI